MAHPVFKADDLKHQDYSRMQALVSALHRDAIESGADPISVAHAVAPVAIELLLWFHPPSAVEKMLVHQIDAISDMLAAEVSTHAASGVH